MNFDNYLKESAQKVEEELEKILSDFLKEAKSTDIKLLPLALGFLNACKGGKRIRGVLVKLGWELAAQNHLPGVSLDYARDKKAHLEGVFKVGAAYEILHSSVLAHDDIIDKSELRRGKASLHKALRPKDGRVGGDHYGISQAISLGDMGFFMAMEIISQSNFLGQEKNLALRYLSSVMVDTAMGEMLDIEKGANPITVMKLKTARYSISGPLILGAILAGGSPTSPRLRRIQGFGENLGIAYQIKDDLLDGDFKLGTSDYCKEKALEYSAIASKMIPEITDNSEFKNLLESMVEYLVKRTK